MAEETTLSAEEQKRIAVFNLNKLDYLVDPVSGGGFAETKGVGTQDIISKSLKVLFGKDRDSSYTYDAGSGSKDVNLYLERSNYKSIS